MKPKLKIFLLSVLCLGLIFGSLFIFKKAPSIASYSYYETLDISHDSLNGNSIWGGGEAFETVVSAGGLDGATSFYSATNKASGGLDTSGALSLEGIPYQLSWTGASDYTGNDTIKLQSEGDKVSVTLDTTGAFAKLYILGTASGSSEESYAEIDATIRYTDGASSQTSFRLYDWRSSAQILNVYKWPSLASRTIVAGQEYNGSTTSAPYLQSTNINVDPERVISSIDLALARRNGEPIAVGVYAITGMINNSAPTAIESAQVRDVAETNATVYWRSVVGATSYRLDVAQDVNFKHILPDYNNLYTQDDSVTIAGLTGNTTYYVRVRAENSEGQSVNSGIIDFTTDPETTPPTIAIIANPGLIQIQDKAKIIGTDTSGVRSIEESLDSGTTWEAIVGGDSIERTITKNGTYCYRATDNYGNISEASCVTYANLDTAKPVIHINTNEYTEGTWTNAPITLSIENLTANVGQTSYYYSEDSQEWTAFNGTLIINEETDEEGKTYYFKAISQANIESDISALTVHRDTTAPAGEISSSNNGWNQFLNTITFGLFFHETKNFTIAASDTLSGIDRIEYLISEEAFESKEAAISSEGWATTSGLVTIDPEKDFILYFKVIDKAGNISIINTDGIVLDTTSASILGYVDAAHTYELIDGETYYLISKLIIEDNRALKTVLINGQSINLNDSNIISLDSNQTYSITAIDKAGNHSNLTIKTGSLTALDLHVTEENYKTSDRSGLLAAKAELARIAESEGHYATTDEQETISNLIAEYDRVLQLIDSLNTKLIDCFKYYFSIPDVDHVTSSSYDEMQTLIDNIESLLDVDSLHLSIEETNTLLMQKRELEERLLRLESVSSSLNALNIINYTDVDIIKTEDETELKTLKTIAETLLAGDNLTDDERVTVESELDTICLLLDRITEATNAKVTSAINLAKSLVSTGYTKSDKDTLLSAKADLETAIKQYTNNYTDSEKQALNDQLIAVEFAINDIDNQMWEEIRRTTFPTVSTTDATQKWTAIDTVGVSATDEYGIDKIEVSSDGGQNWDLVSNYDSSTTDITKNGTYLFRATNDFGNTSTRAVTYRNIDAVVPVIAIDTHGYTPGSWTSQPVTISIANTANNVSPVSLYYRAVSTTDGDNDWLPYTTSILITEDTVSSIYEFKAVSESGVESTVESIEVKRDSVCPTGNISTGTNTINSILNTVTFGLLFDETKTYTMIADDASSGINTIEYLISEAELTESELAESANWRITNGTVSVDPNKPTTIYYRVTDRAGNTSVVSLSGVVFDLPGLSEAGISIVTEDNNSSTLVTSSGAIVLVSDLAHTTTEDLAALANTRDELLNYLEKHPDDTSGIVNSIVSDYANTIRELEETESSLAMIRNSYIETSSNPVTSSDKVSISTLIATIVSTEETNSNHLTASEHRELDDKLSTLSNVLTNLEAIRAELEAIDASVGGYNINTVTKDDLGNLALLKTQINELLNSPDVADSDKEHLQELLATIAELEARIAEVQKALEEAKENDHVGGITPGNVTPADQTSLEDAARTYAEALGVFDSNLSLSDIFDINNRIAIINSALDVLSQVSEFEAIVSRLPNPEDVDYNSRLLIKAAEDAYNALSEYGRSLVGPSLLARYRAVLESYRAYLEGSPLLYAFETLDIFWWALSTLAVMGIFILIVRHTHKHYIDAYDFDDF